MPYKTLIKSLRDGSDKLQLEMSRVQASMNELNVRILHNEGAIMLAVNLQKEAEASTSDENHLAESVPVETVDVQANNPIRSVESVAPSRRVPNGAAKRDPAGVAVAAPNA